MYIDYYMSIESIWTHIGYQATVDLLDKHGLKPRYIPVDLRSLFEATGGTPFRQRHVARQRYRDFEVQRWCERRGVILNLDSPFHPPRAELANRMIIACTQAGHDPTAFIALAMRATWCDRRDIADAAVIAECASQAGLPAQQLLDYARGADAGTVLRGHLEQAIQANVFGTPSLVRDGEVFWGQDRLDLLDEALSRGRAAFSPLR